MATNYLHKKGFIHRDLKPENICIDNNKLIKIIDFGTSRKFSSNRFLKQIKGTPFYMSPEIVNGKCYDQKADMWSVGLILYIMLTGKSPFKGRKPEDIKKQTQMGYYNKSLLHEMNIQVEAIDLIDKLL